MNNDLNYKEFGILLIKDMHELFGGVIAEDTDNSSRLISHVDIWGCNSWLIEYYHDTDTLNVATRRFKNTEVDIVKIDYKDPNYLEVITELVNKHKTFEE